MGGGKGGKGDKGDKGKGKDKGDKGKGKSKGDEAHEDTGLAAALGVDQFDEPDPQCPWCAADYAEDSDFCHSCGKLRKALTCYNCESHYLKGAKFCRNCGLPRAFAPVPMPAPTVSEPEQVVEAPEPQDWIYDDGLVKEVSKAEDLEEDDESWHMRDMCRTVEAALDVPYLPLVRDLRSKLTDIRSRCDFAVQEKQRWRSERRDLKEQRSELEAKVEEEKDKALQRVTKTANHSLAVTLQTGGQHRGRASMRMQRGYEFMEAEETNTIDMAAKMILKSRIGAFLMSFVRSIVPLQTDVQNISSEFGSSCGTFFRFYSYMVLLALLAAAAFTPLILLQSELWTSYDLTRMCGYLPCSFFLGSFYQSSGDPQELWLTAIDVRLQSNGTLTVESHIGQDAFDQQFAICPMVRYVRDCRPVAVFAGSVDMQISAFEVFTAAWKDMPGTQNQDWAIYSRFADLVQAEEPWPTCTASAGQGFPGSCSPKNVELSGRWFGWGTSYNGSLPSYGLQMELFNASRCFVSSSSDVRNMVGGIPATLGTDKDLTVAFWYVFGNMVSIIFAVFFVLVWWQLTEAKHNFEQFNERLEPMRWSSLTLGLWNFRLASDSDRQLWRESVASQLRVIFAEEKEQESMKSRTSADENVLFLKRASGFALNLGVIFGLWYLIWICLVDRAALVDSLRASFAALGAPGFGEWLGYSLAPLVVTGAGFVLPPFVQLLTRLEAWPRSWRAMLNIYRFFLGQILTAGLYMAFSLELLYDVPLWTGADTVLQPLVEPCGSYPCKADHAGAEVLALVATEFVMMMIKPFVKLAFALLGHRVKHFLGVKGGFLWPEFEIQDDAVNVVYFSALLWMSLSTVPYMAFIGPFLMYLHFKWLKFSLRYLTRRTFVTETTSLLVALQRMTCFNFVVLGFLVMAQLILTVPYEPTCGPVSGLQGAGEMIWQLDIPLKAFWAGFYNRTLENRGSIVAVMFMASLVLWMLHQVSLRTNRAVVEQMSGVANRQVASLSRELWRMERRNDLLKRRLEWLEGKAMDE